RQGCIINLTVRAATARSSFTSSALRTATRLILGTASLSSSSRLPPSSLLRIVRPVTLPPGRARLSIRPALTGSVPPPTITMGILGHIHGRPDPRFPSCYHDDI